MKMTKFEKVFTWLFLAYFAFQISRIFINYNF